MVETRNLNSTNRSIWLPGTQAAYPPSPVLVHQSHPVWLISVHHLLGGLLDGFGDAMHWCTLVSATLDHPEDTPCTDAGGLYFFAALLSGRHGPIAGWITGYMNVFGQVHCLLPP